MCGIVGIARKDPRQPVEASVIVGMRDTLIHRGPDDCGVHTAAGIGLGSRRLSIVDLSEHGHMPMATPDGRYVIVHNGEVYNYRHLREPLRQKGIRFRSNTDTEVLLRLYEHEGPDMLSRLNGMFAFAIWDERERTLFLARDRLGIKPLYYTMKDGDLYFGSEEKAILAAGVPASFDESTLDELLCFRYVAGEKTPLSGIRRLLPGSSMLWRGGTPTVTRWWDLGERVRRNREQATAADGVWFRETFDDAVRLRLISDVPVGVLLSGGLDSSSVAASIAQGGTHSVSSFTVRFPSAGYDEGPLARQVAERSGLRHHEMEVGGDELLGRLEEASWFSDAPLAHASDIHVAAISHFARQHVTVLLSGEGSDEFLGGYVRYRPLLYPGMMAAARPFGPLLARLPGRLRKLARYLSLGPMGTRVQFNAAPVYPHDLTVLGYMPETSFTYRESIVRNAERVYPGEPFRQAMFSDQQTFLCSLLDRNDRMTMGTSIECRVPFLDYRIVETLASMPTSSLLPGGRPKGLLLSSIGHRLPREVTRGRKWGFGVPWAHYFRTVEPLAERLRSLPSHPLMTTLPLNRDALTRSVHTFMRGDGSMVEVLTALFMLSLWHDAYFPRVRERVALIRHGGAHVR